MNLELIRKERGLTQVDMAKLIGVSLSSYRMWEVGVTQPNEENMAKLKEVLGAKE